MTAEEKEDETIDAARRCFLRRATTVVGGMGAAAASIPFISYWLPSTDTEALAAPITVDISKLEPKQQLTIPWRGQPVWIIRRTEDMLQTLPKLTDKLRDPDSLEDQQPAYAKNIYRSIKPEYYIAIGVCTHLGCIPNYRPDVGGISPDWLGGFYCPCHGSSYDLAGRVYKGVPAPLNLKIPRYRYLNDQEIIIGEDKDGAET
ncbi:MAG TPA: ubiquinol-cytochrome c reductase iron-sulfur subunit [Gammaproteobacteria bacterium]|nr:ubiquinol-cytochrome c reductase iron-sulfur subunit [Gammaproteobacteria bacterium]